MSLSINVNADAAQNASVVAVCGEVDVSNADQLRSAIDTCFDGGAFSVVVDLAEVPYIDSTGIGVLVGAAHRAAEKSVRFEVVRPQKNVERVLGLLGVSADLNVREA